MKYLRVLFVLVILCINVSSYSENSENINGSMEDKKIVFKLPYKREKNRRRYFSEDVKSALIVDKIMIDGNELEPEYDYTEYLTLADEYKTQCASNSVHPLYISMIWEKNIDNNWTFFYRGYKFVIQPSTEATVYYRVIFPFPFGNSERLLQRKFNKKYISKVYLATIVLPNSEIKK